MKKTNTTDTNGGIRTDSGCIIWNGPEIACLDICAGDKLNDLVYAIATKVCESTSSTDLSTLSLQCLVDKLGVTLPTEKNILTILQVLVNNDCHLKDLIDAVDAKIVDTDVELNLNLSCLGTDDIYGNPILLTQIELDQVLITAVCSLKTRMTSAEGAIVVLQSEMDTLQATVDAIDTDPEVTTCIGSAKPMSDALVEVAADYCTYKGSVGTLSQIAFVLAQQGAALNTEFHLTAGWVVSPATQAQSLSNLWIAFNSYFNRLKVIEQTCCAPTCDKIKIGFIPTFDFQAHTVTLLFSSGAGTVIPAGFEDVGTDITFTDVNGLQVGPYSTALTPIAIDAEVPDLYLAMLASGILTVSFKTFFVLRDSNDNIILTCKDCYSVQVPYDSGCCVYTNDSDENIIIIYETTI